jgi:NAD-dependent dihydropyrimidine dehydrogenase PreA subunit
MAILDLNMSHKATITVEDYGQLIQSVLSLKIPFTIVQYTLTERGVVLRISVPDEKTSEVRKTLRENGIQVSNSIITINEDRCNHCGACISLCASQALFFELDNRRGFDPQKCVGCKFCVDACPRKAIFME